MGCGGWGDFWLGSIEYIMTIFFILDMSWTRIGCVLVVSYIVTQLGVCWLCNFLIGDQGRLLGVCWLCHIL